MKDKTTPQLLAEFQNIWDECLNGCYKNQAILITLSHEIKNRNSHVPLDSLDEQEKETLKYALLFANLYQKQL